MDRCHPGVSPCVVHGNWCANDYGVPSLYNVVILMIKERVCAYNRRKGSRLKTCGGAFNLALVLRAYRHLRVVRGETVEQGNSSLLVSLVVVLVEGTILARARLHDSLKLLHALLLVVRNSQLEPELERRQLVGKNLHDLVWIVWQVVLRQRKNLILRSMDGNREDPRHRLPAPDVTSTHCSDYATEANLPQWLPVPFLHVPDPPLPAARGSRRPRGGRVSKEIEGCVGTS